MKSQTGIIVVALVALSCGLAFSQNPPIQDPVAKRVEKQEQDLGALRLRIEALSAEVGEVKKELAIAMNYIEEQAKSAAAMESVLDQSEKAGFTYGINPDSRHILLRGWREQLATAQRYAAPQPPPAPAPVPAPSKTSARR